jgi:hypothetical protein
MLHYYKLCNHIALESNHERSSFYVHWKSKRAGNPHPTHSFAELERRRIKWEPKRAETINISVVNFLASARSLVRLSRPQRICKKCIHFLLMKKLRHLQPPAHTRRGVQCARRCISISLSLVPHSIIKAWRAQSRQEEYIKVAPRTAAGDAPTPLPRRRQRAKLENYYFMPTTLSNICRQRIWYSPFLTEQTAQNPVGASRCIFFLSAW